MAQKRGINVYNFIKRLVPDGVVVRGNNEGELESSGHSAHDKFVEIEIQYWEPHERVTQVVLFDISGSLHLRKIGHTTTGLTLEDLKEFKLKTEINSTNANGVVITMPIQIDYDVSGVNQSFTAEMDAVINFDNLLLPNGSWGETALSIKALSIYDITGGSASIRNELEESLESFTQSFNVVSYENNYFEPCNPGSSLSDYNSSGYFENREVSYDEIFMNHITQFEINCPKCSTTINLNYENDQVGNLGFNYFGGGQYDDNHVPVSDRLEER